MRLIILVALCSFLSTLCLSERPGHKYVVNGVTYYPTTEVEVDNNLLGDYPFLVTVYKNGVGTKSGYVKRLSSFNYQFNPDEADNYSVSVTVNGHKTPLSYYYYYHPNASRITWDCGPQLSCVLELPSNIFVNQSINQ